MAVLIVGAVILISFYDVDFSRGTPFLLFYPVPVLAFLYGGLGPGLLAAVLAGVAVDYVLLPPYFTGAIHSTDLIRVTIFVATQATLCFLLNSRNSALQRGEAELHTILDNVADGVIVSDLKGQLVYWNRAAAELHGFTSTDDYRRHLPLAATFDLSQVDGSPLPVEHWPLARILRGEHLHECEVRIRRIEGDWYRIFTYGGTLVRDTDDRPLMAVVTLTDITERERREEEVRRLNAELERRVAERTSQLQTANDELLKEIADRKAAEEAVQSANAYNRSLIEASLDPLVTIGTDGTITDVNAATEAATGCARAGLIGADFSDYFTDPEKARAGYEQAFRERLVRDYPLELRRRDGQVTAVLYNASVYRDQGGEVKGVFAAARDITARKRAEEEIRRYAEDLERSNQELEHFAYVASHDLQEPLRTVSSFSQLLARRYQGQLGTDADEFITFIVGAATRMQTLIDDLLAFSRIGTRGNPLAPVDYEEILRAAKTNLDRAIAESGAIITHDPLPTLPADRAQLTQLFQNLFSNAIKFRRPEETPRIHLSAARQNGAWRFTVRDNGIGIDPQYFERIFIIFQRLHGREEYSGTGIGLAICKKIVERHSGRIWVESVPGRGSAFHFTIPEKGKTYGRHGTTSPPH